MANGTGAAATARATLATLDARVQGLDRDYQDIKRTILDLDSKVDQSVASLANRFENSLSALANKIEAKSTTQWPVIFGGMSVMVTILTVIGTMAYLPIQRETARLDAALAAIVDRGVYQREYTADQLRLATWVDRLENKITQNVQQQRYNSDQERLTKSLDAIHADAENLRTRNYDIHGRLSKIEQAQVDINNRYDAVSNRLAQQIRDFVAAMREIDRGTRRVQ